MAELFCSHCGGVTKDYSRIEVRSMSRMQLRLLDALVAGQNRYQSKSVLIDKIYEDDPEGGPDDAVAHLRVHIHKLRSKLEKSGFSIEVNWGVGYRLIKLEDQAGAQ